MSALWAPPASTIDWNAVSALASAAAAIAAAWAIWLTVLSAREQRAQRRIDRRAAQYDAWIADPAILAIRAYADEVRAMLTAQTKQIAALSAVDPSQQALLHAIQALMSECDNAYYRLKGALTVGAEAWEDPSFRESVQNAVLQLQDDVNLAVDSLQTGKVPDFEEVLNRGCARIYRSVRNHDPALQEQPRFWARLGRRITFRRIKG